MNLRRLLDAPQLGEFVWHQVTADPTVAAMSEAHLASLRHLLSMLGPVPGGRRPRVLELGAYRHYSGHTLAGTTGAEVWLSDISAEALRAGRQAAVGAGIDAAARLCAADFHDLPFADGYFDLVYIASAVHHSRRPEVVLSELLRVVRPGGLLWLENEPVGREACFYQFNSNRPESYTDFERRLAKLDLIRLISSPFPGTRPEEMFCMVENDRIPLDLYLETLQSGGSLESLTLDTGSTIGAPERELIRLHGTGSTRAARIDAVRLGLRSMLDRVGAPDPMAEVLGFGLPLASEVHRMARRLVLALDDAEAPETRRLARAFGAALRGGVRRRAGGAESRVPLRRELPEIDGVLVDTGGPEGAAFLNMRALLPDVHDPARQASVLQTFDPHDWGVVTESFGANSLYNLAATARLPALAEVDSAILLMRVYTVPDARGPYVLRIQQGARVVAEGIVAQAESRLLRGLIHRSGGPISLVHCDLDGRPLKLAHNLRISVLQYIARD